ncbi:hypothetical protein RJ55_07538 [Drechmeria coniospora]|nr:hypothetical protein RJ55_07538 [Drechmeria coniospora]
MRLNVALLFAAVASAGVVHRRSTTTDTVNDIHNAIGVVGTHIDKDALSNHDLVEIFKNFLDDVAASTAKLSQLTAVDADDQKSLLKLAEYFEAIGTRFKIALEDRRNDIEKANACYTVTLSLEHTQTAFSALGAAIIGKVPAESHELIKSQIADFTGILDRILDGCHDVGYE